MDNDKEITPLRGEDNSSSLSADTSKDSLETKRCPKCFYTPTTPDDMIVTYGECPACGIIVEKYLKLLNGEPLNDEPLLAGSGCLSPQTKQNFKVPSFWRLTGGALCSLIAATCIVSIIGIIGNISIAFMYPATSINTNNALAVSLDIQTTASYWETFSKIAVPLFIWLFIPISYGRTWGMKIAGLWLVKDNGEEATATVWLLRQVGNVAILCSFGVLLVVPLLHREQKGVADLISHSMIVQDTSHRRNLFFSIITFLLSSSALLGLRIGIASHIVKSYEKRRDVLTAEMVSKNDSDRPQTSASSPQPLFLKLMEESREINSRKDLVSHLIELEKERSASGKRYIDDIKTLLLQQQGRSYNEAKKTLALSLIDKGQIEANIYTDEVVVSVKLPNGEWWECGTKSACTSNKE